MSGGKSVNLLTKNTYPDGINIKLTADQWFWESRYFYKIKPETEYVFSYVVDVAAGRLQHSILVGNNVGATKDIRHNGVYNFPVVSGERYYAKFKVSQKDYESGQYLYLRIRNNKVPASCTIREVMLQEVGSDPFENVLERLAKLEAK